MDLQTRDYMPVLNRIDEETTDGGKEVSLHRDIYGSELLKESLAQDPTALATEKPKVVITRDKGWSTLV